MQFTSVIPWLSGQSAGLMIRRSLVRIQSPPVQFSEKVPSVHYIAALIVQFSSVFPWPWSHKQKVGGSNPLTASTFPCCSFQNLSVRGGLNQPTNQPTNRPINQYSSHNREDTTCYVVDLDLAEYQISGMP